MKNFNKFMSLSALFIASLLVSNIISTKLFAVGGIVLTVGIITYPITFLMTDVIGEVWGKATANSLVFAGLIANVAMLIVLYIANALPAAVFWPHQEAFSTILMGVPRIVLASMLAYIAAQFLDVNIFHSLKHRSQGKHLWFRNNVSTMTSQLIDSIIFITVAFVGTMPTEALMGMVLTQYVVKLIIAALDTPFCYMLVNWCNGPVVKAGGRVHVQG